MSRVLQPAQPTNTPVLPGTSVTVPLTMGTSISAGQYVYLSASGYGNAGTTANLGKNTVYWPYGSFVGYSTTGNISTSQYGPVAVQGPYTGSTITQGQQLVGTTNLSATANTQGRPSCTLSNGNFVFLYQVSTYNWYFKIVDGTGATVAGPTFACSPYNDAYRRVAICPLANGGFIIAWDQFSNRYMYANKYDNSGTLVANTNYSGYNYASSPFNINVIELSNGNIVFSWVYTNYYAAFFIQAPDLTTNILASNWFDTSYATTIYQSYAFSMTALFNGGFAAVWYDGNYTGRYKVLNNAGTTIVAQGSTTVYSPFYSLTMCPISDGGFAYTYNTGTLSVYRYTSSYTSAGATTVASGVDSTAGVILTPVQNNQLAVAYFNNSNGYPYVAFTTSTSGAMTWGSPVLIASSNLANSQNSNGYTFCGNASGKIALPVASGGSGASQDFIIVSSLALTNGQTLTGASITPPNYIFQGVSLDTVSAGQTANVVINGTATVSSSYPSVTSPIFFDLSGTGQFGNSGSIIGRTITLKGLQ